MISIEYYILIGSILILLSIGIAKLTENLGIPTLILFLGIGMLAGSEGIGGIYFDNANIAQVIGIVALVFILFAGGLDTEWNSVKPVLWQSLSLSTIGVIITASVIGIFAHFLLGISILSSLLLGAIISSTDAAAVFSVLRSKNVALKNNLKPLLEFESGSNDPMAVFLTIGLIQLSMNPDASFANLLLFFIFQMGIGLVFGFSFGKIMVLLLRKIKTPYQGVYPVFALGIACFVFSITALLNGSGFLAVYITGIIVGNQEFIQGKNLTRFFDGMAWLSQIIMFLTLGLLVFPSRLIDVAGIGFLLSLVLMFLARPVSVFISLIFNKLDWKEKAFISWVGLRGAVPIILATFPLINNLPNADLFFSIVFFIVLTSALLQGWSLNLAAKLLKVDTPLVKTKQLPIELTPVEGVDADLIDFYISHNSSLIGKSITEIGLPQDSLIVLINRDENYIVPGGSTVLKQGDILITLVSKSSLPNVQTIFLH